MMNESEINLVRANLMVLALERVDPKLMRVCAVNTICISHLTILLSRSVFVFISSMPLCRDYTIAHVEWARPVNVCVCVFVSRMRDRARSHS